MGWEIGFIFFVVQCHLFSAQEAPFLVVGNQKSTSQPYQISQNGFQTACERRTSKPFDLFTTSLPLVTSFQPSYHTPGAIGGAPTPPGPLSGDRPRVVCRPVKVGDLPLLNFFAGCDDFPKSGIPGN